MNLRLTAIVALGFLASHSTTNADDALSVFKRRILPIMNSPKKSSCTECHLSGVELKNYIHSDQATTFAALRRDGLIDVKHPAKSKILTFIARKPKKPNPISEKIRQKELAAFRAWLTEAAKDPKMLRDSGDASHFRRRPAAESARLFLRPGPRRENRRNRGAFGRIG